MSRGARADFRSRSRSRAVAEADRLVCSIRLSNEKKVTQLVRLSSPAPKSFVEMYLFDSWRISCAECFLGRNMATRTLGRHVWSNLAGK